MLDMVSRFLNESSGNVDDPASECQSPEFGHASRSYQTLAIVEISIWAVIIFSGVGLWYAHRNSEYLGRRNPLLTFLFLVPVLCSVVGGPLYRLNLNSDNVFSRCFLVNFTFALLFPTMPLPYAVRMITFYYRVKLNQKIASLDSGTNNTRRPSAMSASEDSGHEKEAQLREIQRLKKMVTINTALKIALVLLVLFAVIAFGYTAVSCPVFGDTCSYAGVNGLAVIFIAGPGIFTILLYVFFNHFVRHFPDPYRIRREVRNAVLIAFILGVPSLLFTALNVGKFNLSDDDDPNTKLYFKWLILGDLGVMLLFLNSVHLEVYHSRYNNNLDLSSMPYDFKQVMNDPIGLKLFQFHLESEYSVENLKAYQIMKKWKSDCENSGGGPRRATEARNIFHFWLDFNNPIGIGINVSGKQLDKIKEVLDANKDNAPTDVFDEVIEELEFLMSVDSFRRFCQSDAYRTFVGTQEATLLEQMFPNKNSCVHRFFRCCTKASPAPSSRTLAVFLDKY